MESKSPLVPSPHSKSGLTMVVSSSPPRYIKIVGSASSSALVANSISVALARRNLVPGQERAMDDKWWLTRRQAGMSCSVHVSQELGLGPGSRRTGS